MKKIAANRNYRLLKKIAEPPWADWPGTEEEYKALMAGLKNAHDNVEALRGTYQSQLNSLSESKKLANNLLFEATHKLDSAMAFLDGTANQG